ncbi:MAG TPA: biotin transporter BioY [Candidatus Limnocylindria bacterium]|nr:biotin transporter BioY [Candidatus Limnocylindria bacterium]
MSVTSIPARPATLGEAILPRLSPAARAALLVTAGAALTALAAQVSFKVPGIEVPFTGQTAAVLLTGAALGGRLGPASMLLYIALGAVGLPVYSGGAHGIGQLIGHTGGYLVGFVVATAIVGRLAERGWDRTAGRAALLMVLGNLVIYAIGVPVLAIVRELPLAVAIQHGAVAFFAWDAAKILLAAGLLPLAWLAVGRRPR